MDNPEVTIKIFAYFLFRIGKVDETIKPSWVKILPVTEIEEIITWAKEFLRVSQNESCPVFDICSKFSKEERPGAKMVCVSCPYFLEKMEEEIETELRKKVASLNGKLNSSSLACMHIIEDEKRMKTLVQYPDKLKICLQKAKDNNDSLSGKGKYFLVYRGSKKNALGRSADNDEKALKRTIVTFSDIKEALSLIKRNEDGSQLLLASFFTKDNFILGQDGKYLSTSKIEKGKDVSPKPVKVAINNPIERREEFKEGIIVIPSFNKNSGKGRKPASWEVEVSEGDKKKKFLFIQAPMPDICQLAFEFSLRQMHINIVQRSGDGTKNEFDWAEKLKSYPVRSRITPEIVKYLISKTALINSFEKLSSCKNLDLSAPDSKVPCDDSLKSDSSPPPFAPCSSLETKPKWEIFFGGKMVHGFNESNNVLAAGLTKAIADILGFDRSQFVLKRNHKLGEPITFNWRDKLQRLNYNDSRLLKDNELSIKRAAEESAIVKSFRLEQQEKLGKLLDGNPEIGVEPTKGDINPDIGVTDLINRNLKNLKDVCSDFSFLDLSDLKSLPGGQARSIALALRTSINQMLEIFEKLVY